jgi:uncharacterized membrane protein YidH (DUF202 family)
VKTTRSRIGLIAVGIMLAVVGVILRFATSVHSSGFNVHKVGDALLLVGVVVVIVVLAMSSRKRGATRR